jgi:hypothetical protein
MPVKDEMGSYRAIVPFTRTTTRLLEALLRIAMSTEYTVPTAPAAGAANDTVTVQLRPTATALQPVWAAENLGSGVLAETAVNVMAG